MKNIIIVLLGVLSLQCAYAGNATFKVNKPYKQVRAMIQADLERCAGKTAGLFNSGRKVIVNDIDLATIYHIKEYQMTGEVFNDLGNVIVSDENGAAVIAVTNQPSMVGTDLHLIESVRYWLHGGKSCIPNCRFATVSC